MSNTTFATLQVTFSWIDYGLFFTMLLLSILIGLYFAWCGHQNNAQEYFLGGKQMSAIPIGISLIASNISGITMLGMPTDIFCYGITYYLHTVMLLPICLVTYFVYVPVFYKLQVVSTYEYLMIRFNRKIRLLASGLYFVNNLLYLPIVIYIPALALAQATHFDLHYITPVICGVCVLYTAIGGMKAVIWTDTLQFFVMIGAIIGVFIHGLYSIGGYEEVWIRAEQGKRLDFDFDVNPTKRDTVLATMVGTAFFGFTFMGVNQSMVQKYLSMPTIEDVKKALTMFYVGMVSIFTLVTGIGLILYATYYQCDPFTAGKITKHDQILPFYVMEVSTVVPGLAGMFLSGLLSAALSTLSASMNSIAASLYEDFVSLIVPSDMTEKQISNILKLLVFVIGIMSTGLVYVVENLGNIITIHFALAGISNGPLLGLFTLGMLFPIANSKGALIGSITSLCIMTTIITGNQIQRLAGNLVYEGKPVSIEGCNQTFTLSPSKPNDFNSEIVTEDDTFILFKITHYYYIFLGTFLTVVLGVLVSYVTRMKTDVIVNPDALSPLFYWFKKKFAKPCKETRDIREMEMQILMNSR